ncbi:endonuclease/exonuclease/phosphatase family protein [Hyalangium minutum]|uniref:Endonuclease/exonuclease/phosphatase n=1 Tax=Hyalangium minutum TaxID=394096 RepID=A0A085WWU0_9BACT|nr:endonuclease/exonuclease/phosphatase family protein [Hyalangium minutum]KFE72153.1 Endonuclease/exonuclease/phosphatase [Hyalangium minutum]
MNSSPRRRPHLLLPLFTCSALLVSACGKDDSKPTGPVDVTVMTRNVYLGANIFLLSQAKTRQEVPSVAAQLYATVQATNFPERAGALAAEIEAKKPALVGLQEVSLYRTQHPSDFFSNGAVNALVDSYDFLGLLQAKLRERGLDYRVAARVKNGDAELPAALSGNPSDLTDIRLTDYDVILARGDVQTSEAVEQNYVHNAQVAVGGSTVTFTRGFTKVDAEVDGAKFTFVNSHLEGLMPANEEQAHELVGILEGFRQPLILVGDLNTGPGSSTPAYGIFSEAGYTDAWTVAGSGSGFTCCVGEKLLDTNTSGFDERIDLMFYAGDGLQPVSAEVVGDELGDRTPSGLWPSDHAGTVVTFRINR